MDEQQSLLRQIGGMFDAFSTEFRQEMTEIRLEMTEIRLEMTQVRQEVAEVRQEVADIRQEVADFRREVDERFAAQDARIDEKLAAQNAHTGAIVQEVLQAIGEQLVESKGDIIQEVGVLFENTEGQRIRLLEEETDAGRDMLADHEVRITDLEEAAHTQETVGTH